MAEDFEARLAAARADQREEEVVARRLVDTRADRARLVDQIEATKVLLASEQADVDRLQTGVGSMFRRMAAERGDLSQEKKELAAAEMQLSALTEELHAVEVDLTQLCEREAKVSGASGRLAVLVAQAPQNTPDAKLSALTALEGRVVLLRRELAEAIAVGTITRDALAAVNEAAARVKAVETAADLAGVMGANETLRKKLGLGQRALQNFQRECREVAPTELLSGIETSPMPSVVKLIAHDTTWHRLDGDVKEEADRLHTLVENSVSELRGRDAQLELGLSDLAAQRAALG